MTMVQNPQLLTSIYNMEVGAIPHGLSYNPPNYWARAEDQALRHYDDLMAGNAASATAAPTTLRSASRPMPTLPVSEANGPRIPTIGTSAGGKTNPGGTLPTYDTGAVESLAQRFAAPGIRNLRNTMQETQQGYYENPNVKRMTLRDAVAGYGQGLESTMAGALNSASSIYGQQYGAGVNQALQSQRLSAEQSMQADRLASNERLASYNNEWRAYLASMG